jgi:hypothetical protein
MTAAFIRRPFLFNVLNKRSMHAHIAQSLTAFGVLISTLFVHLQFVDDSEARRHLPAEWTEYILYMVLLIGFVWLLALLNLPKNLSELFLLTCVIFSGANLHRIMDTCPRRRGSMAPFAMMTRRGRARGSVGKNVV